MGVGWGDVRGEHYVNASWHGCGECACGVQGACRW
jgi:hypothetical protein